MLEIIQKLLGTVAGGGGILDGARGIIDEVVTSKEEKAELERKFAEMVNGFKKDMTEAENADRDSARKREIETTKSGARNITHNVLAYIGVVAFFGITGFILSRGLASMNAETSFIVGNLTGMAGAIAKDIYGYYFGSSKGERDSQNIITSKNNQ